MLVHTVVRFCGTRGAQEMQMNAPYAGTRNGALYIDLENLMIRTSRWSGDELSQTITTLKMGLHLAHNIEVQSVWATAQRARNDQLNRVEYRLTEAMRNIGVKLVWCSKPITADERLISKVEHELTQGTLLPIVLFLTDDGGFATLVNKLKTNGKFVVAIGVDKMSGKLRRDASMALALTDLTSLDVKT